MKTSKLTGTALDWAVAKAEGNTQVVIRNKCVGIPGWVGGDYNGSNIWTGYYPSVDWSRGGPIIEREHISSDWLGSEWSAKSWALLDGKVLQQTGYAYGPTELIAKMRCFVASKLGDEVDVPEELLS